jgi:translation initiation factor IF-2
VQERRRLDKERERAREELLELAEERHEEGALDDLLAQAAGDDVSLPVRDEPVEIPEGSTVAAVAETLGVKASVLIGHMFQLGAMVTINDSLPMEVLEQLQEPFTFTAVKRQSVEDQLLQKVEIDSEDTLVTRAPVVTIMGHVDHGKTSLLDAVRKTNVAEREAGSITQHIGAYDVKLDNGRVVFLDTPGHEAFTAMRARGAHVTDVVVLVVAADDGVMPQTVEAINHARAAEVPIVVAVNKVDVARANPDNVRTQLSAHDLMPEDWGGTTVFQNVSAETGEGIPELLEYLALESELLELKANPDRNAVGTVVEAELSRGRGAVATVLVQNGTLKVGDYFVAGSTSGRVRALIDDHGTRVQEAPPSTPVEVLGFSDVASPGDQFLVLSEEDARALTRERQAQERQLRLAAQSRITLDDISRSIQQGQVKDLNVIIKADVEGSVEPLQTGVAQFDTDEVRVGVIHAGVGAISETDIMLAAASSAIILGFHVGPTPEATRAADREGVEIRTYEIIYDVTNDIRAALEGMLDPELSEQVLGRATVREVFKAPRFGAVAGSYVNNGRFLRGMKLRLLRDNRVVHEGVVDSLRRFREDVREVAAGFECGIAMGNYSEYQEGDVLECFTHEEVARTLEASAAASVKNK